MLTLPTTRWEILDTSLHLSVSYLTHLQNHDNNAFLAKYNNDNESHQHIPSTQRMVVTTEIIISLSFSFCWLPSKSEITFRPIASPVPLAVCRDYQLLSWFALSLGWDKIFTARLDWIKTIQLKGARRLSQSSARNELPCSELGSLSSSLTNVVVTWAGATVTARGAGMAKRSVFSLLFSHHRPGDRTCLTVEIRSVEYEWWSMCWRIYHTGSLHVFTKQRHLINMSFFFKVIL